MFVSRTRSIKQFVMNFLGLFPMLLRHYIAGYYMFYLPLWCGVPLVTVAFCGYLSLCYKRYYLR
eukprot:UN25766